MTQHINCLRCHRCKLLPDTNLSKRGAVIWCEKKHDRMPLILSGCGIADPRLLNENRDGKWQKVNGDRSKFATAVEDAWLREWYARLSWPELERAIGRSRQTISNMAKNRGMVRGKCTQRYKEAGTRTLQKLQERGLRFNAAQSAYIEDCFARNFWPMKHFGKEPYKSQSESIRAEIVARVAELDAAGRVWRWESIRSHMKWVSPSYRRETPVRNRSRRAQQRLWHQRKKAA